MDKCKDGSWVAAGLCPDTCDNQDSMTIDFMHFVQTMTNQPLTTIAAGEHHGFCSTDIQQLVNTNSDAFNTWSKNTIDTSVPGRVTIHGLEAWKASPGETNSGTTTGNPTSPVTSVQVTLSIKMTSVSSAQATAFAGDVATALGIDPSRVTVAVGTSSGTDTTVTVTIKGPSGTTDTTSASDAASSLTSQVLDPQSALRTSDIGASIDTKKAPTVKVTHADGSVDDTSSAVTSTLSIIAAVIVVALL